MKSKIITLSVLLLFSANTFAQDTKLTDYVDPRIGSEGLGRVFIGPSCPYGMVKPSPDCTPRPNSGWLPMPEQVDGFSQVHVSGTGGGPKYGNILVMPFGDGMDRTKHIDHRKYETIKLGYYTTQFQASGIQTEITTAPKASFYRFTYPKDSLKSLAIDAGFFLGESPVPDAREAQQFVGSEIQIISDREVIGYTRIRGGWNNGRAYTVYFYAETDKPFVNTATWKGDKITNEKFQYDSHQKTGALLRFNSSEEVVQLKVGISFLSSLKARQNAHSDIPHWSFETAHQQLLTQWEDLLQRIEISPRTPEAQKRMFYTGLYHTMIMPVDRSGENPLWADNEPYYDDFYAIGCEAICRAALKYQADSGEFAPFACRYIYNAIIDHCRAMNYRLQRSVDAGFEEGEVLFDLLAHTTVDFEAEVTDDSAMAALRACKEKYQGVARKGVEAIELKLQGYESVEIADLYGTTVNNVNAWISRARSKLRNEPALMEILC